ncbi:MAG TPA: DEAD/DEAH box helicase [Oscillatoriaceae cyanobacterium]
MDVFRLRGDLIKDYAAYVESFINVRHPRIKRLVQSELRAGALWPAPLLQLNPNFAPGATVEALVQNGQLHAECARIFRAGKDAQNLGAPLNFHRHQVEAFELAERGENYVVTTGTGSGKSLTYIVPIVNHVLRARENDREPRIRAIIVYPMNALANSQEEELRKYLQFGYPEGAAPVTFASYTGQDQDEARLRIKQHPPDILLTNYVMLELLLTRPHDRAIVEAAQGLEFLVFDELHTYRGRQGADVAMLIRRLRDAVASPNVRCVGTSATMATEGNSLAQQAKVAEVASRIFGTSIGPEAVVGETLVPATNLASLDAGGFAERLKQVVSGENPRSETLEDLRDNPLAIWLEHHVGVRHEADTGRLVRAKPRAIEGADGLERELLDLIGEDGEAWAELAQRAIRQVLNQGAQYRYPETERPFFAFRLHQFISRGDTVYATLDGLHTDETQDVRYLTLQAQVTVPGEPNRRLFPLYFCRACGHEYYKVEYLAAREGRAAQFVPLNGRHESDEEDQGLQGYLYLSLSDPFPSDRETILRSGRLPDSFFEQGTEDALPRLKRERVEDLPQFVEISPDGHLGGPIEGHFLGGSFKYCLCCGVSYDKRDNASDFASLNTLSSEGRATATTVLSLAAVQSLRQMSDLSPEARKLLSFTDNRQDASLQAGHFNDFVEVATLRTALYKAVSEAGQDGLHWEDLPKRVFEAFGDLPYEEYANPEQNLVGGASRVRLDETRRILRKVLGYRLFRDLERGWRITLPNLEQCGLLEIHYVGLKELAEDESAWSDAHGVLHQATRAQRQEAMQTILDFMRQSLAIRVEYLDPAFLETLPALSASSLNDRWGLDSNERPEEWRFLYPCSSSSKLHRGIFASGRSSLARYLTRPETLGRSAAGLKLQERQDLIVSLLEVLSANGFLDRVPEGNHFGYQLFPGSMRWCVGDGTRAWRDPIRVPREPTGGMPINAYFKEFYMHMGSVLRQLEAREHTAQVDYRDRAERETAFREARLPVLYCSPTMELGIDIASLNMVNMRNVPPTPANYAQRSGRAGRSGQPALVFTYCSTGNSHDQFFFRKPAEMVAGAVAPPRLDLGNQDLLRAHVHAIWLAETGQDLGRTLGDLLDLDEQELPLRESVRMGLSTPRAKERAFQRAQPIIALLEAELQELSWYDAAWLGRTLDGAYQSFDRACDRWREIYRDAKREQERQNAVIMNHSRSAQDKNEARARRAQAETQINLLTGTQSAMSGDFYSYRYFASEGFLPGYSFPRLPLTAFVPGARRGAAQSDTFISRPRFLAISEFGPRALIYHEGNRFQIDRIRLPLSQAGADESDVRQLAKICHPCGLWAEVSQEVCEGCGKELTAVPNLLRLSNVLTRRVARISADEEERRRQGFKLKTRLSFARVNGAEDKRIAELRLPSGQVWTLVYAPSAVLHRINYGEKRQKQGPEGFLLDTVSGQWVSGKVAKSAQEKQRKVERVIPYVEDRRNALLIEPGEPLGVEVMASLQAALKNAIQRVFQLEDSELAAEPLPDLDDRRKLLFFEASEGGAGVLSRLVAEPDAWRRVAEAALEQCHFDTNTGADRRRSQGMREDCGSACYHCLMNYGNQIDHGRLKRHVVQETLVALRSAELSIGAAVHPENLAEVLLRACQSDLERRFIERLLTAGHHLPAEAQKRLDAYGVVADFYYKDTVVFVDSPIHDAADRAARDRQLRAELADGGFQVLVFRHDEPWEPIFGRYPSIFGPARSLV